MATQKLKFTYSNKNDQEIKLLAMREKIDNESSIYKT